MTNWQEAPHSIQLVPKQVHIWTVNLLDTAAPLDELNALLDPKEHARAQRFHFPEHRRRFIAAHGILRRLLEHYLSIPATDMTFSFGQYDKPYLANHRLEFNVSHSADQAAYAFTLDHPIGIDIEEKTHRPYADLAERFFTDHEFQAWALLPTEKQTASFFHLWTQKEAVLKALGTGLSKALDSFQVTVEKPAGFLQFEEHDLSFWTLIDFAFHDDFAGACATQQTDVAFSFFTNTGPHAL